MATHHELELRSILLHAAVAEKLRADPGLLDRARHRVRGWLETGEVHPRYAQAWSELLAEDVDKVAAGLVEPDERMRALRQCSPLAGVLSARERWALLRRAGSIERTSR